MSEIKLEDFPEDGDINWRELANDIGIENAMKVLERGGGRKIWMVSPDTINRNKRIREFPPKNVPCETP